MWSLVGEMLAEVTMNHLLPLIVQEAVTQAAQHAFEGTAWLENDPDIRVTAAYSNLIRDDSTETHFPIVSRTPGRVRYDVEEIYGDHDLARDVEDQLHAVPGIINVTANGWTGRVLVRYNPTMLNSSEISSRLREILATCSNQRSHHDALPVTQLEFAGL